MCRRVTGVVLKSHLKATSLRPSVWSVDERPRHRDEEQDEHNRAVHPMSFDVATVRGAIMAIGQDIEAPALHYATTVPPSAVANRKSRDGNPHHITLVSKAELSTLSLAQRAELEAELSTLAPKTFVTLGLASATGNGNTAWFVPVVWPSLQALRERCANLAPAQLHITIGFDRADVHGCAKGPLQLMPLVAAESAARDWIDWTAAASVAAELSRDSQAAARAYGDAAAEALAAVERLEAEASIAPGASPEARADLICSRCELLGRLGVPARDWAADAAQAVDADGQSARAWLALARAHAGQKQWQEASASVHAAIERAREPHVRAAADALAAKLNARLADQTGPARVRGGGVGVRCP